VFDAKPDMVKNYSILLTIEPSAQAEISYEGEYGFSYLKVTGPEVEA
jgi:hypothetical protein